MNSVKMNTRKLDLIMKNLPKAVLAVEEKIGAEVVAVAKELAPVDEGALRASIYMRTPSRNDRPNVSTESGDFSLPEPEDRMSVVVGPSVGHGIWQELGTSKMAAQPYLAPAVRKVRSNLSKFHKDFGRALGDG
jgi:hypothetical protein